MKFKMIELSTGNAISRFMGEFADSALLSSVLDNGTKSFQVSFKRDVVVSELPERIDVHVLEIDSCDVIKTGDNGIPFQPLQSGCAWSCSYNMKMFDGPDSDFMKIYSNGKCLYDGNVKKDYRGITGKPLEYYFGKDNLSEALLKRAAGFDIKINPKYDPDKYASLEDMMM